jgi:hypothetical protein
MKKAVALPISRAARWLPPATKRWFLIAFQGPAGLYAIQSLPDARYQVHRLMREDPPRPVRISEPFLTPEGARQYAMKLAEGVDTE